MNENINRLLEISQLTISKPDDFHVHFRDNNSLKFTVPATSRDFGRALIMPNLNPPIETVEQAAFYHARIVKQIPKGHSFQPLMTLYLTQETSKNEIIKIHQQLQTTSESKIYGVKLYPAGATTNSQKGISDIKKLYPIIELLEKYRIPLLLHGEVVDSDVDIFDRENFFIENILIPLLKTFPQLKVVLEHITTKDACDFITESSANIGATITPQHLLYNRNDLLVGGIKPHLYCLPILKRNIHQQALIKAATSGNKSFFLGTDSAPHPKSAKESNCGCAGCFSAPFALSIYAEIFHQANALDKLEAFASFYGADFYDLPRNQNRIKDKITLLNMSNSPFIIPNTQPYINEDLSGDDLVILGGNQKFSWKILE